jgi:lipopolysaccharide transport system permease protein
MIPDIRARPRKIIQPDHRWVRINFREIAASRELIMLLSWSAFTVRFKQMVLGMLWAALEPLALMLTMMFVFSFIFRLPSGGLPYSLLIVTGLVAWMTFHRATMAATDSISENMHIISKIYFPRIILPVANSLREIYGAIPLIVVAFILCLFYGFMPSVKTLALPFLILLGMIFACGIGLWLSTLVVRWRDLRHILAIVLQMGVYLSPVAYHPSIIPDWARTYYELNPMYWVIMGTRWALLDVEIEWNMRFWFSVAFIFMVFFSGLFVFSRHEQHVVDES